MKKNMLIVVAVALAGAVTFTTLQAQNTPPATGQPVSPAPGTPGARPGFPGGFRGRPGMNYRNAVMFLKRVKTDLENSKEEYDGHRQSALEAVDKAMTELEAVQSSIQAAQAKAAAARAEAQRQAAPTTTPPATTPAPAAPNQ